MMHFYVQVGDNLLGQFITYDTKFLK